MSLGALIKGAIALGFARWNPTSTALVHPVTGEDAIRPVVSYTWVGRPAAASNTGITIRVTDVGGDTGSLWISNGTYWKPVGGHVVLESSGLAASVSETTSAETLATILVPAYSLGTKGRLRVTTTWTFNNTADNKIISVKFGASTFFSTTITTNMSGRWLTELQNRNATNSQIGGTGSGNSSFGTIPGAVFTAAVDTTADVNITLVGKKTVAGDTCTLEAYAVELIHP